MASAWSLQQAVRTPNFDVGEVVKLMLSVIQDGYVRIWSTEAIYNAVNASYDKPKQLASMSYHSGTIHTVRFSPGGKFLASGADDKIVCIYTLDPSPPSHAAFGKLTEMQNMGEYAEKSYRLQ
jgi:WD40 repeat protein